MKSVRVFKSREEAQEYVDKFVPDVAEPEVEPLDRGGFGIRMLRRTTDKEKQLFCDTTERPNKFVMDFLLEPSRWPKDPWTGKPICALKTLEKAVAGFPARFGVIFGPISGPITVYENPVGEPTWKKEEFKIIQDLLEVWEID